MVDVNGIFMLLTKISFSLLIFRMNVILYHAWCCWNYGVKVEDKMINDGLWIHVYNIVGCIMLIFYVNACYKLSKRSHYLLCDFKFLRSKWNQREVLIGDFNYDHMTYSTWRYSNQRWLLSCPISFWINKVLFPLQPNGDTD
jgi:hypothetical protein